MHFGDWQKLLRLLKYEGLAAQDGKIRLSVYIKSLDYGEKNDLW
ncbi:hypothetical protein BGP_4287 [Beggiatoa sp. PS]|nr:hypothetical protein BGP_4287 [Beggiatoa sp. PS]